MVAKSALERLLGRKLVVASHAGSLRGFLFQDLEPGAKDPRQHSLHIMCSWRIDDPDQAITGSGDWYEPAAMDEPVSDDWDPSYGGSLQEMKLRELFRDPDLSRRTIANNTGLLIAEGVDVTAWGDFTLRLSGQFAIRVFRNSSRDELWRVFVKDDLASHFVCGR